MLNGTSRLLRRITTLGIALVVATGIFAPKKASAALTSAICSSIIVVEAQDNELIISCNTGVDFYAQSTALVANCPVKAADTLKAYQSLATSALLSGKSVKIWYDSVACGGHFYPSAVDLRQ